MSRPLYEHVVDPRLTGACFAEYLEFFDAATHPELCGRQGSIAQQKILALPPEQALKELHWGMVTQLGRISLNRSALVKEYGSQTWTRELFVASSVYIGDFRLHCAHTAAWAVPDPLHRAEDCQLFAQAVTEYPDTPEIVVPLLTAMDGRLPSPYFDPVCPDV